MTTKDTPNNDNQNFDLEEIVLNTNQSEKSKTENKKKNISKSWTSNTRENKIKKEKTKQPQEETIDDILEEEENQKNRSRIFVVILILLIWFWLFRLIRQKNWHTNTNNTNQITTSTTTWKDTEKTTNNSWDNPLNNFLNHNKNLESLWGEYNYNNKEQRIYYKDTALQQADKNSFEVLWKEYAKDKYHVYYQWQILAGVEPDQFKVIQDKGKYKLTGIVVNSKNLLNYLKIRQNREFLMTTIASITNKNINVKSELTQSSVYAMDGFKEDFNELNQLQRWENMTPLQRAKFWVIFLYIKLIKSLRTDEIRMSKAKKELQYFIEHHDKILKEYGPEKEKETSLQWNLGYDEYCIYTDGKLSTCFLNKIFVHQD